MAIGILLWILPSVLQAQQDTVKLWNVELTNENSYIGKIISNDGVTLVFDSQELGVINIRVREIVRLTPVSPDRIQEGEFWFENPQATRYFWAPTGYGLKKGDAYYQNVWVFFNQISVGITDNVSIGAGVVPLFIFGGAPFPVWITPKVSFSVQDKLHLGGGALLGTIVGESESSFGIAYGTATMGTRDKNFNVGLGYGLAGGEWANAPTITVSGMIRTGKRGYILTENYFIDVGNETLLLLSLGGRSVGKTIAIDYGGFIPLTEGLDTFIAIPWLGISVPLGKRKPVFRGRE